MKQELWDKLRSPLEGCCEALLSTYGVDVHVIGEAAESRLTDDGMAAFIGFTGDMVRGSLAICAPTSLIARAVPVPRDDTPQEVVYMDWICELSNQLLGRLKLHVARHGVVLSLSTPNAVCGRNLHSIGRPDAARTLRFRADDGTIFFVEFEAETTTAFVWADAAIEAATPLHEGDLMIFL